MKMYLQHTSPAVQGEEGNLGRKNKEAHMYAHIKNRRESETTIFRLWQADNGGIRSTKKENFIQEGWRVKNRFC